jgi:hypothetical protein
MSDKPTPPTTAAQVELRGESMNEKRRADRQRELLPLMKKLRSPIPADEVERVTAIAAGAIRALWMKLEYYEAEIEELRKREKPASRPAPISQSGADEPQHEP